MRYRFLGDIHGEFAPYKHNISDTDHFDKSVQLGDFGCGFVDLPPFADTEYFIRGNHDDPSIAKACPNCIPDGHVDTTDLGTRIMYVGGALSIDQHCRTMDVDWWSGEELNQLEMVEVLDKYIATKPDIMVTHTVPETFDRQLFPHLNPIKSRTGQFFQALYEIHRPKMWIFGHFHENLSKIILGTEFLCLGIHDFVTIEL